MAPTLGRIVHYRTVHGLVPAMITGLSADGTHVDLTLFPRNEAPRPVMRLVPEGNTPGTWSWPPRIADGG